MISETLTKLILNDPYNWSRLMKDGDMPKIIKRNVVERALKLGHLACYCTMKSGKELKII